MQLTFRKLGLDYYPVHRPGERDHWSLVSDPEARSFGTHCEEDYCSEQQADYGQLNRLSK